MRRIVELLFSPSKAADREHTDRAARAAAGLGDEARVELVRRSVDARSHDVVVRLRMLVTDEPPDAADATKEAPRPDVRHAPPIVIVGSGPAGLFAALTSIENGRRPIVLERGKDVRARRRDLALLTQRHIVDPDSNYCFGEGGAGTYSDGKLYTRSKRGDVNAILETFVAHGADPDILVDAHPHIGTNKLPAVVASLRASIVEAGGDVRFGARVTDIVLANGRVRGVVLAGGDEIVADDVILATGHSARDVFEMLHRRGLRLERKGFAMGVRVEHPQAIIDAARYHTKARDPHLPPASYSAVRQVDGLGVYAFCMCPGGIIAPCATAQDEVVTNGWSPSKRNNPFANSGIVVEVPPDASAAAHEDPLAGVRAQRALEQAAWAAGGRTQTAPAQRLVDFLEGRTSPTLPPCSYIPGVVSTRVDELLPRDIARRLQVGLRAFGRTMRGYVTNEAVVVAVESRTSSPVRIPRDPTSLEHPDVRGLYPCGEGAGYAGGIVSAAMDGVRCALAACARVTSPAA